MAQSVTDSNVTLIDLEETEPDYKKAKHDDDLDLPNGNGLKTQKSKRAKYRLKWRKNRKVNDTIIHTNKWTENSEPQAKPELTIPSGNGVGPKHNANGTSNIKREVGVPEIIEVEGKNVDGDSEKKESLFSWIKSIFSRKDKEFDIDRSNKSKMLYFGFLTPVFVFHPEALQQCDTAKQFDENFKLDLAAAHIDDALHSRGKFGKARALIKPAGIRKCFKIISSHYWEYLLYLFIALHSFMVFWEQSPVPTPVGQTWNGNWTMHPSVLAIDAFCTVMYVTDIALSMTFLSWTHFWHAKEHFWIRVEFIFTIMFIIDFVVLVFEKASNQRLIAPFRCLRAAMLLCKSKNVSHIFKVLISIMSRLGKVFAIIFIFIFTFASIGLHLYMADYSNIVETCTNATRIWNCTNVYSGAFDQIAIAGLHMFVLMSTENYPDVIIPAYEVSPANFFYFMFYLYAGVFFLTAILLAIIVESYWEYSKKQVKVERLRQREQLIKAWNLLDLNGVGYLNVDDPKLVKLFSILRPKNSDDENLDLLGYMSENNEDNIIDSYDWTTRLVETLSIEFEPEIQDQHTQKTTDSDSSRWIKFRKFATKVIHAPGIGVTILVLILLHSIFFALMWKGINDSTQLALQICRSVFIFAFVIEVTLSMVSDGSKLLNILDILDILMVLIAIGGNVAWYILWFTYNRVEIQLYLGACIVLSSLAVLARLLFNSEQARSAVHILRNIYPVMFDLILLVITIIYFYAILGLEIFQDNTLEASEERGLIGSYVEYDCGVGFETFGCALMIVFQIVTTNDWHQIMLGAMIDAGWASSFYFVSCYLIIDMIVMNLFVAISIEAYKKLARDTREIESQPAAQQEDNENQNEGEQQNQPEPTSTGNSKNKFGEAAMNAFTGIFASTRGRRTSSTPVLNATVTPGTIQVSTFSIHAISSDEDSDEDTIISRMSVPGSPRLRNRSFRFSGESPNPHRMRSGSTSTVDTPVLKKTGSIKESTGKTPVRDRRQRMMRARGERVKKERKEKQQKQLEEEQQQQSTPNSSQSGRLDVPSPKLSISDIVKLKKMVRVLVPYRARTSKEMSLQQGEMFSVSEVAGNMYKGPNGWFPKNHTVEMEMDVNGGPFAENVDSPSSTRKRKTGKVVNFQVENETIPTSERSPSTGRLQPSPQMIQHRASQSRMRLKQDRNDWRKDILGDMTVMNKKEMEELKKLIKGGNFEKRQPRNTMGEFGRPSVISPRRVKEEVIQESIEEREEEPQSPEVPEVRVSKAPIPSDPSSESNDDTLTKRSSTGTLSVPGPVPKKVSKGVSKSGEMPEWAKNFVASTGAQLQDDVKFDEASLKPTGSSDEEDRVGNLAGVLVHRSDTGTGSSSENVTVAPKGSEGQQRSLKNSKNPFTKATAPKAQNTPSATQNRKKKSVTFNKIDPMQQSRESRSNSAR